MQLNYVKSQSTVKPELIDTTSSKTTVYLRKNIIERQIANEDNSDEWHGPTVSVYEYDEAKLTKEEYNQYLKELSIIDIQQQRADIDYIALMTGVDLEEV